MRKLLIFKVFLALVVICVISNEAPAGDTTGVKKKGLVIYRDRVLEPPFEFTGFEEDTLRLNGIPYSPVRKYEKELRKWKKKRLEEEIELMKKMFPESEFKRRMAEWKRKKNRKKPSMETIKKEHELDVLAYEKAKKAKTYEDKVNIFAKIMEESPIVDSTRILEDKRVMVYWKGMSEPEYSTLPRKEKPPLTEKQRQDRRIKYNKRHMKDFWDTYNKGGTVVFGDIGGYLYSPWTEETLKAIEKLSRGDTLTSLERERSIFIGGERILYLFKERFRREGKGE